MNRRHFTLGIGLVLLLAGAGNSAEVTTQHVRCSFSATFLAGVETHLDTNGDGLSASAHQGLEKCTTGRFLFHEAAEFQAPIPAVTCPAGTLEVRLQQERGVSTEVQSGDQLFFAVAANEETVCLNPADFTFRFTARGTITGGTGQFRGARGTFASRATGKYFVTGEKEGVFGGFGQFSGSQHEDAPPPEVKPGGKKELSTGVRSAIAPSTCSCDPCISTQSGGS